MRQNPIQNSGFVPKQQRAMFLGSPELGLLVQTRHSHVSILGTEACLAWFIGMLTLVCLQMNHVPRGYFLALTPPGCKCSQILLMG